MKGQRAYGKEPHELAVGEYSRWDAHAGNWYARCPDGAIANLSRHEVTEHEDGTITVSPSILVTSGHRSWHGWLERGTWRTC